MDFDLFVQNENKINNKKQKKNNRPFSSNPLGKNLRVKSSRPRVKTGLPKLNNEYFPDNIKNPNLKITLDNKFDQTNEFHNNMKFRETRPKSRYNDKIFNRYWEMVITEPKTVFAKDSKKKLNKLNIEIEKDFDNLMKQTHLQKQKQKQKIINTDITPIEKIMQGDRNLYKFPQINWEIKKPSRFLNHVGGINFDFSKTTRPDSSRPGSGLNVLITDINNFGYNSNISKQSSNSRPITAMNKVINNQNKFNRPTTAINTNNRMRPKTAFHNNMIKNNLNNINNNAYTTTSSSNNTNIKNNMKEIPLSVQTKLEKEIKEKYKYKNELFDTEEDNDELEQSESNEIINSKYNNILKSHFEEEKNNNNRVYTKVQLLLEGFSKMDLQNYSIKTNQADKDILDLFDRAQKTHASTLGKVGENQYFSIYQRIASFMDFSSHLKIEALLKIGKDI